MRDGPWNVAGGKCKGRQTQKDATPQIGRHSHKAVSCDVQDRRLRHRAQTPTAAILPTSRVEARGNKKHSAAEKSNFGWTHMTVPQNGDGSVLHILSREFNRTVMAAPKLDAGPKRLPEAYGHIGSA